METTSGTDRVCVAAADVAPLSDEGLRARLGVIGRAESALAVMKAAVLGEIARREDAGCAERAARDLLGAPRRDARRDVELGVQLRDLEVVQRALDEGEIPVAHARLIARAAAEGPIDEQVLADAARWQSYERFARTVRRHQADLSADDGKSLLDHQRERRSGRVFTSPDDGMLVLRAEFDPITGAQLASAISAKERELWRDEDPAARPSPQQRTADAIAKLILESNGKRPSGTALLIVADYDVVQGELTRARLGDGTPIPIDELVKMACDADILPAVFRAATGDMRLGRTRRTASDAQRAALAYRDQGCVGCSKSPDYCEAHHIVPWKAGGRTNLDNLVLVCHRCHHHIHDDGWIVRRNRTTGHYELRAAAVARTRRRGPPGADVTRPPSRGADVTRPPSRGDDTTRYAA
ncbi:HNH endonuclease [Candidatus Poriferisodalis sp.]|uniref:HNH endonuclease signature motif containing protein n=1 Tax=Candidatus Poriferisodalis sp. TaxID=3101277 RepID=UPI003C6FC064